jgi:hypothetical protein
MEIVSKEPQEKNKLKGSEVSEIYMYKSYLLSEAGWHQKNVDYLSGDNNR